MKKTLILSLVLAASACAVFAQGTVNFANVGTGLNAPVFLSDGTTRVPTGYTAQLLTGAAAGSLSAITTTAFVGNGYFTGGTATINVAPGQTAYFQILAYLTSQGSYAAAVNSGLGNVYGQSGVFTVIPADPLSSPPGTPTTLTALQSFNLNPVPEPTTLALLGVGAASLLVLRRRK